MPIYSHLRPVIVYHCIVIILSLIHTCTLLPPSLQILPSFNRTYVCHHFFSHTTFNFHTDNMKYPILSKHYPKTPSTQFRKTTHPTNIPTNTNSSHIHSFTLSFLHISTYLYNKIHSKSTLLPFSLPYPYLLPYHHFFTQIPL